MEKTSRPVTSAVSAAPAIPTHDARLFDWLGPVGSADMSTFNGVRLTGRAYGPQGATPPCFALRSPKTGAVRVFYAVGTDEVAGEVIAVRFETTDGSLSVKIYNS